MIARANLRFYQRHPMQLVLLVLGVMLGVAVVTAVELISDSARHSFREAQLQITGRATHRIEADKPIPDSLYALLRRDSRDWQSAPVITAPVRAKRDPQPLLRLIGVDPLREQGFRNQFEQGRNGTVSFSDLQSAPVAMLSATIAQEMGLSIDDELLLQTSVGLRGVTVGALLDDTDDPRLQRLLVMDIGQAQQLLAMTNSISHIDLILGPQEVGEIQELLPQGVRLKATQASLSENDQLTRALYFNLQALSLLALVVGLFLVYSSVSFSLSQRHIIFARLRLVGVHSRNLYRYLLIELLCIAICATVLGIGLGIVMARMLLGVMLQTLSDLYASYAFELLLLQPLTLLSLMSIGVLGSLLAAWAPCRQIARISPLELQQRHRVSQQEKVAAVSCVERFIPLLLIIVVLLLWTDSGLWGAFIAIAALLLAAALCIPAVLSCCSWVLDWGVKRIAWSERFPLLTMIIRDLIRHRSRTAIAAMALMMAVSATVGIGGMVSSFRSAVTLWLEERLIADLYVAPERSLPGRRAVIPEGFITSLQAMEEIEALVTLTRIRLIQGQQPVYLYAAELPPVMQTAYQFIEGDRAAIWQALQQESSVLISEPFANRMGLARGDRVELATDQGPLEFTVAGIYFDYGSDSGRILTLSKTFNTYWPGRQPYALALFLPEGLHSAELAQLEHRIHSAWTEEVTLEVQRTSVLLERSLQVFNRTFLITDLLRLLAILVAFIGMLSSLLAIQLERQNEVSVLKAVGFSRNELIFLLLGQSLLLGICAGVVAIVVGEALSWGLTTVVQLRAFGWSIPYAIAPSSWLTALATAVLASLLASIYPSWRFSRLQGARHWE